MMNTNADDFSAIDDDMFEQVLTAENLRDCLNAIHMRREYRECVICGALLDDGLAHEESCRLFAVEAYAHQIYSDNKKNIQRQREYEEGRDYATQMMKDNGYIKEAAA